jgi:hypothetical protein
VGEPVEQGRGHLGISEDRGPFVEAQVRRDDDAGSLSSSAKPISN